MPDRVPEDMPGKMPEHLPDRMPEDLPENMPEDMPDRMPEDMPDRMPDRMSEDMPEDMSDRMPDRMPEDMPGRMPEDMPDRMPEDMSDRMPEDLPVTKWINVMVGITRSKVVCRSQGQRTLIWSLHFEALFMRDSEVKEIPRPSTTVTCTRSSRPLALQCAIQSSESRLHEVDALLGCASTQTLFALPTGAPWTISWCFFSVDKGCGTIHSQLKMPHHLVLQLTKVNWS